MRLLYKRGRKGSLQENTYMNLMKRNTRSTSNTCLIKGCQCLQEESITPDVLSCHGCRLNAVLWLNVKKPSIDMKQMSLTWVSHTINTFCIPPEHQRKQAGHYCLSVEREFRNSLLQSFSLRLTTNCRSWYVQQLQCYIVFGTGNKSLLGIHVSSCAVHGILSLYLTRSGLLVADKSENPVGSYCGTSAAVQVGSIPGTIVHMRTKNHSKMRAGMDLWMFSGSDPHSKQDQVLQDLAESNF